MTGSFLQLGARASGIFALAVCAAVAGCSGSSSGEPPGGSGSSPGGSSGAGNGGSTSGASGAPQGGGGSAAGAGGSGGVAAGAGGSAGAAGSGGGQTGGCVISAIDEAQPSLLSQTGCIDMPDPTKPAPGLVPYAVRSALWSDAAAKERFVSIPAGAKIHVRDCAVEVDACKLPGLGGTGEDDGHWIMPVGTVLVKNFSIEGKHVETRLFMRRSMSNLTGWKGFSYEWNDAQTEATLLPDGETAKERPVGTGQQVWHYPTRSQCMDCHTRYAGRSLGLSTQQLNSDFTYADGAMNQVDKFEQLGLFDAPPKDLAGYPDPFGTDATLEQRARSYLQSNCASCHRPGGEFSSIDMRYATAFADTQMCDMIERDAGMVPDYRITPGKPAESTMSVRMHALDMVRMPKIGSSVVDPKGTELIDAWIMAMPTDACPPQQ